MTYSKLKVERIKHSLSQTELAEVSNCSRGTISSIENGKIDNVQLGILKKIAVALNSTLEELFLS